MTHNHICGGEALTIDEMMKRFPWMENAPFIVLTDRSRVEGSKVVIAPPRTEEAHLFIERLTVKELHDAIEHAWKMSGLDECHIIDAQGNNMAFLSVLYDSCEMTEESRQKYGTNLDTAWVALEKDARFLALVDALNPRRIVIYQFEISD